MKEIFQSKLFWGIFVILLLAVFVYPPFTVPQTELIFRKYPDYREWAWIFSLPWPYEMVFGNPYPLTGRLDFRMLIAESIIAILISIGVCLIPFGKKGKKKD
jgi:hypothetical protein